MVLPHSVRISVSQWCVLVASITEHESSLITLSASERHVAVPVTSVAGSPTSLANSAWIHPVAPALVTNTGDNFWILKLEIFINVVLTHSSNASNYDCRGYKIFWQKGEKPLSQLTDKSACLPDQIKRNKRTNARTLSKNSESENSTIEWSVFRSGKHWKSIVTMKRESDLKLTFFCDKSWQLLYMRSWVNGILIRILGSWFYKSYLKRSQQLSQFPGLIQFLNSVSILAGKIVSFLITQLHFEKSYPKQMTMNEDLRKIYLCGSKSVF